MEARVAAWHATRKRDIHLPPGVKRKKAKPAPEPKETMDAAGLRIVLDAPPVKLKREGYPE